MRMNFFLFQACAMTYGAVGFMLGQGAGTQALGVGIVAFLFFFFSFERPNRGLVEMKL